MKKRVTGNSYDARVKEVNEIYDMYLRSGISNREILRRYIWPKYKISERTFYEYLSLGVDMHIARMEAKEDRKEKEDRE